MVLGPGTKANPTTRNITRTPPIDVHDGRWHFVTLTAQLKRSPAWTYAVLLDAGSFLLTATRRVVQLESPCLGIDVAKLCSDVPPLDSAVTVHAASSTAVTTVRHASAGHSLFPERPAECDAGGYQQQHAAAALAFCIGDTLPRNCRSCHDPSCAPFRGNRYEFPCRLSSKVALNYHMHVRTQQPSAQRPLWPGYTLPVRQQLLPFCRLYLDGQQVGQMEGDQVATPLGLTTGPHLCGPAEGSGGAFYDGNIAHLGARAHTRKLHVVSFDNIWHGLVERFHSGPACW